MAEPYLDAPATVHPMDEHFAPRAAFIAALSADDGERTAAERHAERCLECREALDQGKSLQTLLKRAISVRQTNGASGSI
jgi:hypothetical protein